MRAHISQRDHTHQVVTGPPEKALEDGLLSCVLSDEHVEEVGKQLGRGNTIQLRKTHISRLRLRRQ